MTSTAKIYTLPTKQPQFYSAWIDTVDSSRNKALIKNHGQQRDENWYRIPMNLKSQICPGDEVLCTGDESFFIVSLLAKKETKKIQTYSPEQELLFEYDPETNKSRVFIDKGDLEFVTKEGDISFKAAKNLNFQAETIGLTAMTRVKLAVHALLGRETAVNLDPNRLSMTSPKLDITSQKGTVQMQDMRYTGEKCFGKISSLKLVSRKLDIAARTISQKAENIFQKIKGLSQTKAGRKTEIIENTYHLKADQAIMKTDQDFKVKAEKIHLG